jgi:acetylornithine aminotransferase
MDNAFFGNSGAEANEAAIKIARLHGHANNIDNPAILTANQSITFGDNHTTLTLNRL